MTDKERQKNRPPLFKTNDRHVLIYSPALTEEIGERESLLLLQIEFLIRISNHVFDGRRWTYQSVTDLQEFFPSWGRATINRTIHSLQKMGLIIVDNYNKYRYDRTRWFALDFERLAKLESICGLFQNGTGVFQNGTRSAQNGTTIPESSTDSTTESSSSDEDELLSITAKDDSLEHGGSEDDRLDGLKDESDKRKDDDLAFDLDGVDRWLYDAAHGFGTNGSTPTRFQNIWQRDMYREKVAAVLGDRTPEAFILAHESPDPPTTTAGLIRYAKKVADNGFYGDDEGNGPNGHTHRPSDLLGLPTPANELESKIRDYIDDVAIAYYKHGDRSTTVVPIDGREMPYAEFAEHFKSYCERHDITKDKIENARRKVDDIRHGITV